MLVKIAAFVVPLAFDTFAVAVALGVRDFRPLQPAFTFAFFEAVMPLVGLALGRYVGARFETPAVVFGGLVLLGVAVFMFKEAFENENDVKGISFSSFRSAMLSGFGISMDELAIGFPMGTSGLPVPETVGAIALQAFIVTYAGITLGKRVGDALGRRTSRLAEFVAAAAFALLGIYLVTQRFVQALPQF
jgi:manganese efflux pump family protein